MDGREVKLNDSVVQFLGFGIVAERPQYEGVCRLEMKARIINCHDFP